MPDGPDPLGKRALYWLPVEEQASDWDGGERRRAPAAGDGIDNWRHERRHARPAGKHALFSSATPAGEAEEAGATTTDPLPPHGILTVACSSCGTVSRVGVINFLLLHFPIGVWLPGRVFDRWMTCPACRRRAWMSVTLSR
ncbi:MAG: hypothetical protein ABSC90_12905 [Acidimicrobiales bacterium]